MRAELHTNNDLNGSSDEQTDTGATATLSHVPGAIADDYMTREAKLAFYGPNIIRVHVTPVFKLVVSEERHVLF